MISVVIPVLNEATNISRLLIELEQESESHEVIVVDGGSSDDTVRRALDLRTKVISTNGGRGRQIEKGISESQGDILLMLHADSFFPSGGLSAIRRTLDENPECPGGNFGLVFDGGTEFSEWITRFYAGIRRLGFYYGDSGIFVRRIIYKQIGGMRPLKLMEDYDFVCRLEKIGHTICINDPMLVTSIRRFRGRRRFRIVLGWLYIHILYYFGASSDRMAKVYDNERKLEQEGIPKMKSPRSRCL